MTDIDRRRFVSAGALGAAGLLPRRRPGAGETEATAAASAQAPADVTRGLAAYVVQSQSDDLPAPVRAEACRTLLNWTGCAIGGSRHETVDIAVRALNRFAGPAQASVLGRRERMDILNT